jgi:tetratricopeptide (TPR) repeat protein
MDSRIELLIQRARSAFDGKDYRGALDAAREVLSANPNFADLRHLAGLCHSLLGEPELALEQFDYALALNPQYVEAHIHRALTLTDLCRYDDARDAFDRAALYETGTGGPYTSGMSARLANAHADVGDLYVEAGAHAEAADQYRRALDLRPLFHDIRNKLAQSLIELAAFDDAVRELERVRDGNPRFLAARLNLGLVFYRLDRLAEAEREWRACEQLQASHPQLRAYLALLEARLGWARRHEQQNGPVDG